MHARSQPHARQDRQDRQDINTIAKQKQTTTTTQRRRRTGRPCTDELDGWSRSSCGRDCRARVRPAPHREHAHIMLDAEPAPPRRLCCHSHRDPHAAKVPARHRPDVSHMHRPRAVLYVPISSTRIRARLHPILLATHTSCCAPGHDALFDLSCTTSEARGRSSQDTLRRALSMLRGSRSADLDLDLLEGNLVSIDLPRPIRSIAMPRTRKHIVRQCAHAVSRGTAAFHGSPRPLSVSAPLLPPCDQDTRHVRPRCECPMSQVHSSPRQADRAPMIQGPRTLASIPKTQPWSPSQTKGPRTISHRDCPARTPAGFDSMLTRTPALRTHPASTQICSRLVSLL